MMMLDILIGIGMIVIFFGGFYLGRFSKRKLEK